MFSTMVRALLSLLLLLTLASPVLAQSRATSQPSRAPAASGETFVQWSEAMQAAATAAGLPAADTGTLAAAFAQVDANGDGVLDATEQARASGNGAGCGDGQGVCRLGACYCVPGAADAATE
jgi:hypothetical protein